MDGITFSSSEFSEIFNVLEEALHCPTDAEAAGAQSQPQKGLSWLPAVGSALSWLEDGTQAAASGGVYRSTSSSLALLFQRFSGRGIDFFRDTHEEKWEVLCFAKRK